MRKSVFGVAGAVSLALIVGACANPGAASEPAGEVSQPVDVAANETYEPTRREFLLEEYIGSIWPAHSTAEQQRRQAEENLRREELIAQCMNDAGFEYLPNVDGDAGILQDAETWQPENREWVAQYGYGALRVFNPTAFAGGGLGQLLGQEHSAANQAIVDSLSDSERAAYELYLWGEPLDFTQMLGGGGNVNALENSGCWGRAMQEIRHDPRMDLFATNEFAPLLEALAAFFQGINNHPEFAQLNNEWASCMADAGHPGFARQQDAQARFVNEMTMTLTTVAATAGDNLEATPEFAALRDREIELALADLDCRVTTDYRAREASITHAAETQFINDHQTTLAAFRAAAEQAN